MDVLASASFLRVPILIEYDDFKKLQINAATDALTGLYNRRLFDEYYDKELNRSKRYSQQLAVVILDMHKLKEVNDRYGHLQGDQVCSSRQQRCARRCVPPIAPFGSAAMNSLCSSPRPIPNRRSLSAAASARNTKARFGC